MDFTKRWVTHLRTNHQKEVSFCSFCYQCSDVDAFRVHVHADRDTHASWDSDEAIDGAFRSMKAAESRPETQHTDRRTRKRRVSDTLDDQDTDKDTHRSNSDLEDGGGRFYKKRSPTVEHQPDLSGPLALTRRSRARVPDPEDNFDQGPKNPSDRQLWTEADGTKTYRSRSAPVESRQPPASTSPSPHPDWATDEDIFNAYKRITTKTPQETQQQTDRSRKRRVSGDPEGTGDVAQETPDSSPDPGGGEGGGRTFKKRPPSVEHQPGPLPPPATSIRSRARVADPGDNFDRGLKNPSGRQLWTEGDGTKTPQGRSVPAASSSVTRQPPSNKTSRPPQPSSHVNEAEPVIQMMRQPEIRPISQDQLVAEVKGIYAGLVMVETKCIEVDNAQSLNTDANKLNNEQWQALIALHRTLLHEHHDFFLASQHPSASVPLRGLASKYAMPARMWRHGIHSFLELLRHRLPASLEHMLTFLYLAYSMMALLYETVPAFEDTWIECLGDLGRYRMAIEDNDIKDREVWTGVSQHWYSKASNKSPNTGRLYHHLAILARPNALQQLYYYAKSLCVPIPFLSARESVMTLFDPILDSDPRHLSEVDTNFVRVHAILFSGKGDEDKLKASMERFLNILDSKIAGLTKKWLEAGYFMGIATCCSLLGYGNESNVLMKAISQRPDDTDVTMGNSVLEVPPSESFKKALEFAVKTYEIVVLRWGDTNTLPFVHTMMVLIHKLAQYPAAMSYLEQVFPWKLTMVMLNYHLTSCDVEPRMDGDFPGPEKEEAPRPLPEDYAMRGLIYVDDYYPKMWFVNEKIDEDEKYFELASMVDQRKERILYLGYKIAAQGTWLKFDTDSRQFSVADKYDVDLGIVSQSSEAQELTRELKKDGRDLDLDSAPRSPAEETLEQKLSL